MISRAYIAEWRNNAPWKSDYQVEQDLVIERALVELFSDSFITESLAFRGGTALHKLYLQPQARYSEDIDLVQAQAGPVGNILKAVRKRLSFLGEAKHDISGHNHTLTFRFKSELEPVVNLKLKVEINSREHFAVYGFQQMQHNVQSAWFKSGCTIRTYTIEELLGTKLRALYQRKKGRDLFDIWYALAKLKPDAGNIVAAFNEYLSHEGLKIRSVEFIENVERKLTEDEFTGDIQGIIRNEVVYDIAEAWQVVSDTIVKEMENAEV
ncbi:MAG: nucleotidyl transferase AbiEii/AbiGii toxin family protein [Candidatus Kryptoniota bacterium]